MKGGATRTVLATWLAMSVLTGVMIGILRLTNVPSDRLYDFTIDGDEMLAAAGVGVWWSLLMFVGGTPLVWATVALRTRVLARRVRRVPARETGGGR